MIIDVYKDTKYFDRHTVNTISLDEFNKKPYAKFEWTSIYDEPKIGSTITLDTKGHPKTWLEYREHDFEHAIVLGAKDLKLLVYGNKIGEKIIDDNLNINNNPMSPSIYEFKRGDELLLEINKKIRIVHNITVAKLKFEFLPILIFSFFT